MGPDGHAVFLEKTSELDIEGWRSLILMVGVSPYSTEQFAAIPNP